MPTYWIVVGGPENFEIAIKRGFDLFGFKSTRRSETSTMEPGDKLIFYLTGVKQFGGLATVTSDAFEDHKKIFSSEKKPGEDYPFRVKTKPEIVLDEGQRLSVPDYVGLLEMTRKGAMKSWGMAFQGNLHRISDADYKLLEKAMRDASKKKPKAAAGPDRLKPVPRSGGVKAEASSAGRRPAARAKTAVRRKTTTRKAAARR
ncbi:MAG: EVE domain-containing protein [Dehalococcoidia bacterium]